MHGIEIAETEHSVIVRLDKDVLSRETIDWAVEQLNEIEGADFSHVGYVSDNEQADLEGILNSLTDDEKSVTVRTIRVDG